MSETLHSTPGRDGFRMPGEFEPHSGCWMLWPERPDNWREGAAPAQRAYAAVAAAVAAAEPVTVGASGAELQRARDLLDPAVGVVEIDSDDAWMRDVGPTFVVDDRGARRGVDWRFNAWGGKEGGLYDSWERDERVARRVLELEGADRYAPALVLEGGSIHTDGRGTVISTEECLLNANRNPHLGRDQIERLVLDHLGAERMIWLGRGLAGDETDGHVDNLACFARPGVVLLAWTDDPDDPHHDIVRDARERLLQARDARGQQLRVVPVPLPGALVVSEHEAAGVQPAAGTLPRSAGARMAGSYVNFYPANGRIVFPLLDPARDEQAAAVLRAEFPGHAVVGVAAREILLGGGNIHCITQQVPARSRARDHA